MGEPLRGTPIWMKAMDVEGQIFVFRPKQIRETSEELAWDELAARHKRGTQTILGRELAEKTLRSEESTLSRYFARSPHGVRGRISCPKTLDLSGPRRGRCTEYAGDAAVRVEFWIDGTGTRHVRSLDYAYDLQDLRKGAENYYRRLLLANHIMQDVRVDCGRGVIIVVTPPASRKCSMNSGAYKTRLSLVFVQDGSIRYEVPPEYPIPFDAVADWTSTRTGPYPPNLDRLVTYRDLKGLKYPVFCVRHVSEQFDEETLARGAYDGVFKQNARQLDELIDGDAYVVLIFYSRPNAFGFTQEKGYIFERLARSKWAPRSDLRESVRAAVITNVDGVVAL
jgi:hypothetical protein